ncbi:MAG: N-acetylglucosamine repressor [Cellvibrionaceae bacterium]
MRCLLFRLIGLQKTMLVSQIAVCSKITSDTERLILKTIYDAGMISRADVARATHLTRPTVSTTVTKFINDGLVAELGQVTNGRGKPATLIQVVDDACSVIGIDISNRELKGVIFDMRGRPVYSQQRLADYSKPDSIFPTLIDLIDDLIVNVQESGIPLLGIGIGAPGLMNVQDGSVRMAINLGWKDFPLQEKVEKRYQVPVHVFNDSQAAALGQFTFDNQSGAPNLIVIKVGRGISAGIILDGKIYSGSSFGASEIGHLQIVDDGEPCICGHFGCLETVASSRAIVRKARMLAENDPGVILHSYVESLGDITTDDVLAAFNTGDPGITKIIEQAGRHIGIIVANLVGILNIPEIVIAGSLARFGPTLLNAIRGEMESRALSNMVAETELKLSNLGQAIVMQGAASIILHHELGVI